MARLSIGHSAYVRSMDPAFVERKRMFWSSRRGPEHLLDFARFEAPDGFAIEFAVDDVSVFSSSGLSAPAASGQVSIAIDNDGSPQTRQWSSGSSRSWSRWRTCFAHEVVASSTVSGATAPACRTSGFAAGSDRRSEDVLVDLRRTFLRHYGVLRIVHTPSLPA